jgi:hypothetical protein
MNTHADKIDANKSQSVSNGESQLKRGGESTFQFLDNRPEAIAQMKLQEMGNNSPQVSKLRALQEMANNSPQTKKNAQLQSMANNHSMQQHQTIQKKENYTGLPDNLKTGMENLSGISLDDVKVHRNSDKPAQLQAHAYAQGTDIHLASGQEKHLPHEAWHVVQQKQGRVQPTMQMKGKVNVNDDAGLEKEADVMGAKAENIKFNTPQQLPLSLKKNTTNPVRQNKLKIGGIDITSYREKLLDFQKKDELGVHECYEFGEVLRYWIVQEQEYEFVSWDESIIKARDEKLPEKEIPTLEQYWAAHSIAEAEVNPAAAEEAESNNKWTGSLHEIVEDKFVLNIPSGFPALDINVIIRLEKESNGDETEYLFEATGGVVYNIKIAKLGLQIELTLKVKVPEGQVTPWDAAKMAITDFFMRQRRKKVNALKILAVEAIPAINVAREQAKELVAHAKTDLEDSTEKEIVNALKTTPRWMFWKGKTVMDKFVEQEKIVKEGLNEALALLGDREMPMPKLEAFSAETGRNLVANILDTNNENGVEVMKLWNDWSTKLSEEAENLKKLFAALNLDQLVEDSKLEYSIQGMINCFVELGDIERTGIKMKVGAGVRSSFKPSDKGSANTNIIVAILDINLLGVEGKLTGELISNKYWKGELKVKIPGIIPDKNVSAFLGSALTSLKATFNAEAKKEEKPEEKPEEKDYGLINKGMKFMSLAQTFATSSLYNGPKRDEMSDLFLVISMEEEKIGKNSTYKVGLKVAAGTTGKFDAGVISIERTTKTRLQEAKENTDPSV